MSRSPSLGENADRHLARVRFHLASILAGVGTPLDAIVSNPPYIPRDEYETLQPEVREHEPMTALVGGDDGLTVVRQVVRAAARALSPEGRVLMEIGHGQADAVSRIVTDTDALELLRIRPDLQGIPRSGRRPAAVLKQSSAWE